MKHAENEAEYRDSVYSNGNAEKPSSNLILNGQEMAKLVAGNAKSQLSSM